jgi:hypothetical protein
MNEQIQTGPSLTADSRLSVAGVGLLLLAAPGIGYLLTWTNELGYADQYQIPVNLIAPQLGNVLSTTLGFAIATFLIFGLMFIFDTRIVRWVRGPIGPIEQRVLALVVLALVGIVLAIYQRSWYVVLFIPAALAFIAVSMFLPAIRGGPGRVERLRLADKAAEAAGRKVPTPLVLQELLKRVGPLWLTLGVIVLASCVLAYGAGLFAARTQLEFPVVNSPTPEVVLAIYGDTVVLAPFDRSKKTVKPEFDIVKIGSGPLHLHMQTVGPLSTQP